MGFIYNTILLIVTAWAFIEGWKRGFKNQRYLFFYLLITLLVDVILQAKIIMNSLPTFNGTYYKYYFIFSINFFAFFYSGIFRKKRRIVLIIITLLLNIGLISTVDFRSQVFENKLGISLPAFYIFLALMWFQYKLVQYMQEKITDDPYFWISSGLLLWGGFFLFRIIPAEYLFENDLKFRDTLKDINYIISAMMYLLFFVALLKFRKSKNENESVTDGN